MIDILNIQTMAYEVAKYKLDEEIYTCFFTEVVLRMNYGFKVIDHYIKSEDCPICMEDMETKNVIIPPCGHVFDYDCLMETILNYKMYSCPECQTDGNRDPYRFHKQTDLKYPNEKSNNSKDDEPVIQTIHEDPNVHQDGTKAIVLYLGNDDDTNQEIPKISIGGYDTQDESSDSDAIVSKFINEEFIDLDNGHEYSHMFM